MGNRDTGKPQRKDVMNTEVSPPGRAQPAVPAPGLESELQAHIGRQLRAVYDEVALEPVPERFLKLLEDLERKQAGKP